MKMDLVAQMFKNQMSTKLDGLHLDFIPLSVQSEYVTYLHPFYNHTISLSFLHLIFWAYNSKTAKIYQHNFSRAKIKSLVPCEASC
jgi:hypothetical protein